MRIPIFSDVTLRLVVSGSQRFDTFLFHLQSIELNLLTMKVSRSFETSKTTHLTTKRRHRWKSRKTRNIRVLIYSPPLSLSLSLKKALCLLLHSHYMAIYSRYLYWHRPDHHSTMIIENLKAFKCEVIPKNRGLLLRKVQPISIITTFKSNSV